MWAPGGEGAPAALRFVEGSGILILRFLRRKLVFDELRFMGVLTMSLGLVVVILAGVASFFFGTVALCSAVSCLDGRLDSLVVYGASDSIWL